MSNDNEAFGDEDLDKEPIDYDYYEEECIMDEIAEMMLDGSLCQCCGDYIDDDFAGFPRTCEVCEDEDDEHD